MGKDTVPPMEDTLSVLIAEISEPVLVVPIAVMVVLSALAFAETAVARPFWSMVATDTSLEDQATLLVMFWVAAPAARLPRAMNWVVSPVKLAVAPPGMMVIVGLTRPWWCLR